MTRRRDVLLVDAGAEPMGTLAARLRRMDFQVVLAKTGEEASRALTDVRRDVGALVIPPDLPVSDLEGALRVFRQMAGGGRELPILASGTRPDAEARRRLRAAGVDAGIFDPIDAHTLRFLVNRVLFRPVGGRRRRAPRVPVTWTVRVARGRRAMPARLYTLSTQGAFLATDRPALRGTDLDLTLALPQGAARLPAEVVMTNVPGNLAQRRLPYGMAVRFGPHGVDIQALLHVAIEERAREIEL